MRITAEAKAETRQRIIEAATKLFAAGGYENATTRLIAAEAGIATGTLFNYFQSKEAIVAALISDALGAAEREVREEERADEAIEEELFSLIWTELRTLQPYRKFLPAAAETILSPLRQFSQDAVGESIRLNHLEAVQEILAKHGVPGPLPAVTMQLYWTLYLGVFGYWTTDESPNQEDTLALLDQSLKLFVAALPRGNEANP